MASDAITDPTAGESVEMLIPQFKLDRLLNQGTTDYPNRRSRA